MNIIEINFLLNQLIVIVLLMWCFDSHFYGVKEECI